MIILYDKISPWWEFVMFITLFCCSRISLFNKCFVTAICAGDDKYYKICACDDTHYNGGMGDCSVMGGLCNDVKVYWSPYAPLPQQCNASSS